MERIAWNEAFSVGIDRIDNQHKQLIDMINYLEDNRDGGAHFEVVSETLTRLTQYLQLHFQAEEDLMMQYHVPDLQSHREEHLKFTKQVSGFCVQVMNDRLDILDELRTFLREWLVHHIMTTDMKYADYFRAQRITVY
jgi:hemerythrin-like metal-binding protein